MEIDFGPAKSEWNRQARGLPFTLVHGFDWNTALVWEDDREDYGEDRFVALGRIDGDLYVVVYTPRGAKLRIISLRRATKTERALYHG